jgi:hypothetical protein
MAREKVCLASVASYLSRKEVLSMCNASTVSSINTLCLAHLPSSLKAVPSHESREALCPPGRPESMTPCLLSNIAESPPCRPCLGLGDHLAELPTQNKESGAFSSPNPPLLHLHLPSFVAYAAAAGAAAAALSVVHSVSCATTCLSKRWRNTKSFKTKSITLKP